jgi:hypothetical protein
MYFKKNPTFLGIRKTSSTLKNLKQPLSLILCCLLVFTAMPITSRSQNQSSSPLFSRSPKADKTNAEFVPGEILVRYRSEAKAKFEEALLKLTLKVLKGQIWLKACVWHMSHLNKHLQ